MPSGSASRPRLGIIVNPVAGIGAAVALKGSDGPATIALARARGAVPQASVRAERAMRGLAAAAGAIEVLVAPGVMGADLAQAAGLAVTTTGAAVERPTTAKDTRTAAAVIRDSGVELLLFAGGDGTARDIYDAIGGELPMVGIPAGVKMHSGVFAPSPEAAARAGETFLRLGASARLRDADIADVDEQAVREGRVACVLYGAARVPDLPRLVLPMKAGSRTSPGADLEALCRSVAAELEPDTLYLLGPGTTTAAVIATLGLSGTLLGVDAIRNGRLVEADLTENELVALLDRNASGGRGDKVRLVVGLVGGQGVLFGRGNRQLGPDVLRRIGGDRIMILSAADKLLALDPPNLWVDTGDPELDAQLAGYVRVHVGPRQQIVFRVSR